METLIAAFILVATLVAVVLRRSLAARLVCLLIIFCLGVSPLGWLPGAVAHCAMRTHTGQDGGSFADGVITAKNEIDKRMLSIVLPCICLAAMKKVKWPLRW